MLTLPLPRTPLAWIPPPPTPPPRPQVMPYDIGAFRPDPAVSGERLIALHEAFCRFAGGNGGGGDGVGFDRATCAFAPPFPLGLVRARVDHP